MKTRSRRWRLRLLAILYVPLWVATLLGWLAPWIPPTALPLAQLLVVAVPALLPVHLLYLWVLRRYRNALLPVLSAVLASGWVLLQDLRWTGADTLHPPQLRVLSYNVATFDYNPAHIARTAALIRAAQPDVVALQEFRNQPLEDGSSALDYLAAELRMPYYRFIHLPIHIHGTATFSRYPIDAVDTLYLPRREINSGTLLTLDTPAGKVGLANIHLSSYNISKLMQEDAAWQDRPRTLYGNAARVLALQQQRVETILQKTYDFPYPLILAGDFNAVPHSGIMQQVAARYTDTFVRRGQGWGWTFPVWWRLGLRIDYQFCSAGLRPVSHRVIHEGVSDHLPLLVGYVAEP
ncbi:MAG: hypothetical protein OHK0039_44930 [Bacteroidia bacterium]